MFNLDNNQSEFSIEDCGYEELFLRFKEMSLHYDNFVAGKGDDERIAYLDLMKPIMEKLSAIQDIGGEEKFLERKKEIEQESRKLQETKENVEIYKREAQGGRAAA